MAPSGYGIEFSSQYFIHDSIDGKYNVLKVSATSAVAGLGSIIANKSVWGLLETCNACLGPIKPAPQLLLKEIWGNHLV